MTLGILIPAAGASSRMRGRDKLLEEIDGVALLERQVAAALRVGTPVIVTLRASDVARLTVVEPTPAEPVFVENADEGISTSLRAGANWAADRALSGLMVALPDLPEITAEDLSQVAKLHNRHPGDVLRATSEDGQFGHPTVIPARLFPQMTQLTGDTGARDVLEAEQIRPCPLAGNRAIIDLDTPEAWAAWRAAQR